MPQTLLEMIEIGPLVSSLSQWCQKFTKSTYFLHILILRLLSHQIWRCNENAAAHIHPRRTRRGTLVMVVDAMNFAADLSGVGRNHCVGGHRENWLSLPSVSHRFFLWWRPGGGVASVFNIVGKFNQRYVLKHPCPFWTKWIKGCRACLFFNRGCFWKLNSVFSHPAVVPFFYSCDLLSNCRCCHRLRRLPVRTSMWSCNHLCCHLRSA